MAGTGTATADSGTDGSESSSTSTDSRSSDASKTNTATEANNEAGSEPDGASATPAGGTENDRDVAETAEAEAADENEDASSLKDNQRKTATFRRVGEAPAAGEATSDGPVDEDPLLAAAFALPVVPSDGKEAAKGSNRSAAVPNTAPTVTVRSPGSPGMFSSNVYGRIKATDPDRDKLTYIGGSTALGKVSVNRFGSFTYTPTKAAQHDAAAPNGRKTDSIGITVDDGFGGVVTTYVTVTIKPANARPNGRTTMGATNPATGAVTGKVTGTDKDGDVLGFAGSAATERGNVVVYGDGTFVYTPTAEALAGATSLFKRTDRFSVTVTDGHGGTATVSVRVKIPKPGANQSPQLGSPQFTVDGIDGNNGLVVGHINATDPEGFALTYRLNLTVDPGVGTVAVNPGGQFSFVPTVAAREAAFRSPGEDTVQFSAVVTDGAAESIVVITVPVSAKAPPPPPPSTPPLSARVDSFVAATRGRTIAAPDGSYPGECVSLVKRFLRDVHGISAGAWGNAVDYRQGAVGGNQMAARGFVWRTDGNFQNGDILVWGSGAGTAFGHIGIWHAGKLYDQNNYGSGRASAPRTANYSPYIPPGRLGYWRKA
ncbi:VCBS repeat-containing protein [Mycolicibacterium iranicum]|uniref:VCBS repeat-containing protein n=1 Tax=Mycolicibacterium iranicum TaxID=912594 RepID=A0A839PZX1_MYCIR|nr:Ig-like domain-containing protein [Mycolicibacterium iranicum]MBB2989037.1 VCBS repeat-containing protein [Mycolicibacterium iranicum]